MLSQVSELLRWYPLLARAPCKRVAVLVPLSNRVELLPSELISLRHLQTFLSAYGKYFIAPPGLACDRPGFQVRRFPERFFGSAKAHNRLLLWPGFYQAFLDYEFVLIYHLDALVFSDQLLHWCDKGYDYIAPPWIPHPEAPYAGQSEYEGKVGNGGFSLRRVQRFLHVLQSPQASVDTDALWNKRHARKPLPLRLLHTPKKYVARSRYFSGIRPEIERRERDQLPEDSFWVNRASCYQADFKIAPVELAVQFAFECVPRHCFTLTNGKLPFGCHAWERYDASFWQPYLLPPEP